MTSHTSLCLRWHRRGPRAGHGTEWGRGCPDGETQGPEPGLRKDMGGHLAKEEEVEQDMGLRKGLDENPYTLAQFSVPALTQILLRF